MSERNYIYYSESDIQNQFGRIKINKYHFYISRQKYSNNYGQNFEICAILELNINKLNHNGLEFDKIRIDFVSVGTIKEKYSINDKTLTIEMLGVDMSIWQNALKESNKYIDLRFWENNFLNIYLYSGNM